MGYNMKRGAHPLFKDLGSSNTPLEKASPMKHPHLGSVNHSLSSHWDDFTSSVSDVASDVNDWGYKNITKPVGEAAEFVADNASTIGHAVLDVGGVIPVVGEPFDLLNAAIYTAEGDYENAALASVSAIPLYGYVGTAGKAGKYYKKAKSGNLFKGTKKKVKEEIDIIKKTPNQIKKIIKNNPKKSAGIASAIIAGKITSKLSEKTDEIQAETSSKVGNIFQSKRDNITQENINKVSKDLDVDFPSLENKQTDLYIDYTKKLKPDWEPNIVINDGVRSVTNYPFSRGEMSRNMRNKSHDLYSDEFNLNQTKIMDIVDVAKGDSTKFLK